MRLPWAGEDPLKLLYARLAFLDPGDCLRSRTESPMKHIIRLAPFSYWDFSSRSRPARKVRP